MSELMEVVEQFGIPVNGTLLSASNTRSGLVHVVANGHGGEFSVLFPNTVDNARDKLASVRPNASGKLLPAMYEPKLEMDGLRVTVLVGSGGYRSGNEYLFLSEKQADELLLRLAKAFARATLALDTAQRSAQAAEKAYDEAKRESGVSHVSTFGAFRAAQAALESARAAKERAQEAQRDLAAELDGLKQDFVRVVPRGMQFGIPVTVYDVTYGVRVSVSKSDNYEGPDYLYAHLSVFVMEQAAG